MMISMRLRNDCGDGGKFEIQVFGDESENLVFLKQGGTQTKGEIPKHFTRSSEESACMSINVE